MFTAGRGGPFGGILYHTAVPRNFARSSRRAGEPRRLRGLFMRARNKIGREEARLTTAQKSLDELSIDTIRTLSIDMVQKANSGHPGLPLGAAPMAYVLWQRHLRHNPRRPALARPRPLRPLGGPRLRAALQPAAPDGLRPDARRPQGVPPVGQPDARPPRVPPDAGRRGHDRPSRPGHGQRRRAWRWRSAGSPHRFNRPGHDDRRSPDVLPGGRRRPHGGDLLRGGLARRAPEARQARLPLRRQPRHARRAREAELHRGRPGAATRPTAGRPCASRTATPTSTASTARSRRPSASRSAPRSSPCGRRSATARRTRPARARRTAARSGAEEVALDEEGPGLGMDGALPRARRRRCGTSGARSRGA